MSNESSSVPRRATRLFNAALTKVGLGTVGMLALATLASRAFGFLRWMAQSAFVGSGSLAGAYASANQVPNIIFEIVIGGALSGITVPLLAGLVKRGLKDDTSRIASALLTWVSLTLSILAVGVCAGAPLIAQLIPVPADTVIADQHALLTTFLRIFAWQIPLYGVSVVLTGTLQAHKRFIWPALMPLFSSLVTIGTFVVYAAVPDPHAGVLVLGWGTTLGAASLSLPLLVPVSRLGVRLRPTLNLRRSEARRAWALGMSGVGALIAQQVSVVAGLWALRTYGEGGTVAIFQYTQAVYWLPHAVFIYPLVTAAFPILSEHGEQGCSSIFERTCARSAQRVSVGALAGVSLLVAMAPVAARFFNLLTPVPGMHTALCVMAPSLWGYALLYFGQRALLAVGQPRRAWQVAALSWLGVAAATLVLARALTPAEGSGYWAITAFAAAHTVGLTLGGLVVLFTIRRQCSPACLSGYWGVLVRAAALLIPLSALCYACTRLIVTWGQGFLQGLLACIAAALVGIGLLVACILTVGSKSVLAILRTRISESDEDDC
ncbi:murein biosynthesis integral membrane protein MurJ [Gleimia hominis]|uniref:murein biosynthesis integral membrane protein MurJ n=1 Tax=Gleimia hominis TaxID=595468 RepID=UPI000C80D025|nr:lipid II flippase MurJ [Gleimia hominis]WIK65263.1 lipid II flippase MurJ [Gleimia hominis]